MSGLTAPLQATTEITPLPGSTATSPGTSQSTAQFNALNAQDFMQLLIAQLQNQDPTDPVNEQELAGEMAEFSSATGINTLDTDASSLMSAQGANALASASALVGKQVVTAGDALVSNNDSEAQGAFTLGQAASDVTVKVADASGKNVGSVDLGALGAGVQTFSWKADAPDTAYTFQVQASDAQGAPVTATPGSLYTVSGVKQQNGATELTLSGNPNPLTLDQIQTVL